MYHAEAKGEYMIKNLVYLCIVILGSTAVFAQAPKQADAPRATVLGYVRDAGCVHRFHQVVKPLPNGCLQACVRAGSPLVVLTKKEQVYHPISSEIPDTDVRSKLLPFVGKWVKITGHVYERGGSKAIAVEQIQEIHE